MEIFSRNGRLYQKGLFDHLWSEFTHVLNKTQLFLPKHWVFWLFGYFIFLKTQHFVVGIKSNTANCHILAQNLSIFPSFKLELVSDLNETLPTHLILQERRLGEGTPFIPRVAALGHKCELWVFQCWGLPQSPGLWSQYRTGIRHSFYLFFPLLNKSYWISD